MLGGLCSHDSRRVGYRQSHTGAQETIAPTWTKPVALRMALVWWMVPTRFFLLAVWNNMRQRWVEPTERGTQEDCELRVSEDQLLGTIECAQSSLTLVAGAVSESLA